MPLVSRRTVNGLATAGLSLPLLSACGNDSADSADDPAADSGSGFPASTSDIEVGGGKIFADDQVVVTQPTKGEFRAFSSTCTHQGCQVDSVSDGHINCPCHGSRFTIEDGSPDSGPATSPLKEVAITVDGDQITLA